MKTYKTINPISGTLKHLILGLTATAAFLTTGAMPAHGQLIAPVAATAQSYYGPVGAGAKRDSAGAKRDTETEQNGIFGTSATKRLVFRGL